MNKYPNAMTNLKDLEELECTVLHDVDAHPMNRHPLLHSKLFDRIVFNFPHDGFIWPENDKRPNQVSLLFRFFTVYLDLRFQNVRLKLCFLSSFLFFLGFTGSWLGDSWGVQLTWWKRIEKFTLPTRRLTLSISWRWRSWQRRSGRVQGRRNLNFFFDGLKNK